MITSQAQTVTVPWGDRTALFPKRVGYVLSLDVEAVATGSNLSISPTNGLLHNLFGDAVVTMPEGLRCDLPTGRGFAGLGEIGADDDPFSVRLSMQIRSILDNKMPLLMDCQGGLAIDGGPSVFRSPAASALRGSAFIATRHETASTAHRWLNRRQLYGVGRVEGVRQSSQWQLAFTFDLYAGA